VDRRQKELVAAAILEKRARRQKRKTVYGLYEPNGTYGGQLVACLQEQGGVYVEVASTDPDVRLPAAMEPLLTTSKRFKVLVGGRGSGKSIGVGSIRAAKAKDYGTKTLCLRELQNSIEDSVHALLKARIEAHGWSNFVATEKAIKLNGDDVFKYRGLARNPDAVKSVYGFKDSWAEEAQTLSAKSLKKLTPTIREPGSELWFTMNPGSSADPMSQRFLLPYMRQLTKARVYEDELHLIVWMDYNDNPWHQELEAERAHDQVHLPAEEYRHIWLGGFDDSIRNALIPVEHFDAAIDAHIRLGIKPEGAKVAAYDPSDEGEDDKALTIRHGIVYTLLAVKDDGDVADGTDWALQLALDERCDQFVWDGDGLGLSLKRQITTALDGKHCEPVMFRGSETCDDPEQAYDGDREQRPGVKRKRNRDVYLNKRAQYHIRLRDAFAATHRAVVKGEYVDPGLLISLSSDMGNIDQLRTEVCKIARKPNAAGKIQIMSKQELAKAPYNLPSPNCNDVLVMSRVQPVQRAKKGVTIKFAGWGSR
jgi:phage terminase large subunit